MYEVVRQKKNIKFLIKHPLSDLMKNALLKRKFYLIVKLNAKVSNKKL